MSTVFVSVNQTYTPEMTSDQLAEVAYKAWPLTLATGQKMEHLVAVYDGRALMAWRVLGAFASPDETYETNGGPRPRIAFALGSPVPLREKWVDAAFGKMRRGVMYIND